jgi:perosamine synthetase
MGVLVRLSDLAFRRSAFQPLLWFVYRTEPVIPISKVRVSAEAEALVLEVLRSGQLAQGVCVERLETSFASQHNVRHAVAVSNGTAALVLAMQTLGIGPGDEVITSSFTFVATLNAILETGATARFADIRDDFNIDPGDVSRLITDKTRAILPVHMFGYMADMDSIVSMARDRDLHIVEDAAQAVGAQYHGEFAGSIGMGCFSLYATKNVSTGEGGIVTTNSDESAERLRLLRNQGMRNRYEYQIPGHNYRLSDLAAAVGIPQVPAIAEIGAARCRNAKLLRDGLAGIDGLLLPPEPAPGQTHVYHQFTVRLDKGARLGRDDFAFALLEAGVESGIYYPKVVFDYDCYRRHPRVVERHVPRASLAAEQVISLPVHQHLSEGDIDSICEVVRGLLQ